MPDPISSTDLLIRGVTTAGRRFRPSDWAERLASVFSTIGLDGRMTYSPYVRPVTVEGVQCIAVDPQLEQEDARAFAFIMNFAKDNDLQVGKAESGQDWDVSSNERFFHREK